MIEIRQVYTVEEALVLHIQGWNLDNIHNHDTTFIWTFTKDIPE